MKIKSMKGKLRKTLAVSGAVLAIAVAAPVFAQYNDGYSGQGYYGGPGESGWGAYDNYHQWHGARWWHRHQIMWFYRYHPEWAAMDSSWLNEDGSEKTQQT